MRTFALTFTLKVAFTLTCTFTVTFKFKLILHLRLRLHSRLRLRLRTCGASGEERGRYARRSKRRSERRLMRHSLYFSRTIIPSRAARTPSGDTSRRPTDEFRIMASRRKLLSQDKENVWTEREASSMIFINSV